MKCPNCGAEIDKGGKCEFCGSKLSAEMQKENEKKILTTGILNTVSRARK